MLYTENYGIYKYERKLDRVCYPWGQWVTKVIPQKW